MTEPNPYAPPKSAVADALPTDCVRQGKFVVVPLGGDLPPRCIWCNAPVRLPVKKKKVHWHGSWVYLLFLVNVLLYLIVALALRRSFQVSAGLCEAHTVARKRRILMLLAVGVVALGAGWALIELRQEGPAILSFFAALVLFIVAGFSSRTVYAREINKTHARLGGCKDAFLSSLD